jgi:hypothetical protein
MGPMNPLNDNGSMHLMEHRSTINEYHRVEIDFFAKIETFSVNFSFNDSKAPITIYHLLVY